MMRHLARTIMLVVMVVLGLAASSVATAAGPAAYGARAGQVVRASVSSAGVPADNSSYFAEISANGRYVAFATTAGNVVPGGQDGVVVHDVQTGRTELASTSSTGQPGNGLSWYPSISGDGRYVAFMSRATNLVPGDTNDLEDAFVRDRLRGRTERVSVTSGGQQLSGSVSNPRISQNGRHVAFTLGSNSGMGEIMVHDRTTDVTVTVSVAPDGSPANFFSETPVISADGRYVAFRSGASNLVADDLNNVGDIFVRDMVLGRTSLVSVGSDGQGNAEAFLPAISGNGRYVTFVTQATNLVPGHDGPFGPSDLYVRDLVAKSTALVSVAPDGTDANDDTSGAAMDFSGRYIAYSTLASNLVPGDTNNRPDALIYDRLSGRTRPVAMGFDGSFPNAGSYEATFSSDGGVVALVSEANNLVPGETNAFTDVFVVRIHR